MTSSQNESGARQDAPPQITISSRGVSALLAKNTSKIELGRLRWAFVALSRDELHEWLTRRDAAKLFLEEASADE